MAKRRAGTDLTDRNWEDEEQLEQAGTFETAGRKVLEKRVIKKAKRRVKIDDSQDTDEQDDVVKPSPFAGFAFGANNKPSSGFSFKAETPATFSFKSSAPDKPPASTKEPTIPTSNPLGLFGGTKSSTSQINTNGTGGTNLSGLTTASTSNQEYEKKLQNLNRSVSSWIQKHVNENPVCDLTPIFQDYKKHLGEIEKLRTQETKATTVGKQDETSSDQPNSGPSVTSNLFGKSSNTKHESDQPKVDFSFKATSAPSTSNTTSTFSFGSTTGSFGKSETTAATGSLFGSTQPFTFGVTKLSETPKPDSEDVKTKDNEDNYEPPKVEVKAVDEKDSLFSKRCKLFYKKDGAFKDRGVGMLHLKKQGKSLQVLVRADTNLGNIILNVMVPSVMPVSRQGKNNVIIMTPINPPVDRICPKCHKKYPRPQESNVCDNGCNPDVTALLIRVKNAEEADDLLHQINKLQDS